MTTWHRQQWKRVGPVYPDSDGTLIQNWACAVCGEVRELFDWVEEPRNYYHGQRR